jgi:hypothetical protein
MTVQATYDDVNLILKLYELRREEKMRKARGWFISSFHARTLDEFNALCPQGSEENAYFRMVTSYWDMAASFVCGGVLNESLFFQSNREMLYVWERVRDIVPQIRELMKDPTAFRGFETVARSFAAYLNNQAPGVYEAFSARVRGTPK